MVELGAGCALASMVAAKLLSSPSASGAEQTAAATILATDVETTVESTLEENLRANGLLSSSNKKISDQSSNAKPPPIMIDSAVLDWGRLSDDQVRVVFGHPRQESRRLNGVADTRDDPALTILATDVLYNPESHPLLLATLLSLLRPTRARSQDDGSPLRDGLWLHTSGGRKAMTGSFRSRGRQDSQSTRCGSGEKLVCGPSRNRKPTTPR